MILITTQVFPPSVGGIQNLMSSLAYYTATTAKRRVHVFADRATAADKFDKEVSDFYAVTRVRGPKPWRRRRKAHLIAQAVAQKDFDHIFADSWKSVEHLPPSLVTPVTVFAHGNEYPTDLSKQNRIKHSLEKAAHIIAVSNDTRERIAPYLPAKAPRVHVINPPVSPYAPPTDEDHQSAATMWQHKGLRIVCLSRLVDMKGIDAIIRAMAKLSDYGTKAELVVAGAGPDRDRLENLVRELNLNDCVHFAGYVQGGLKTALLKSADIYMQPGRTMRQEREAFGISFLEAGLCGLPSIAGRAGGSAEAVIEGETGLIVEGDDDHAVYQALERLSSDKTFRAQLGHNAYTHAMRLTWPKQINEILATIE